LNSLLSFRLPDFPSFTTLHPIKKLPIPKITMPPGHGRVFILSLVSVIHSLPYIDLAALMPFGTAEILPRMYSCMPGSVQ